MRNRLVVIIVKLVCFETSKLSFTPLKFKNPFPYGGVGLCFLKTKYLRF